jgi:hypothetical protein
MTNIETDAAGRPIAYDSAGRPLAVDAVHGRPVTVDGDPAYAARPAYVERPVVVERRGGGAGWLIALIIIVALVVAAFAFKLINIDEISGGTAPNVAVTGGTLPTFKVDTAKINVGTRQEEVSTPTVDVGSKKTTVDVPTVSVRKADADKPNP